MIRDLNTNALREVQPSVVSERPRRRGLPWFPLFLVLGIVTAGCGDSGKDARRGSIYRLQADPTAENVARLREMLADPDRDVRATALHALVGLGVDDAGRLALDGLGDADGFVRATAAKLLGELGDPANVGVLARTLSEDPDAMARQRASESLATLGGAAALEALVRGLDDPMERVRMACVEGLSRRVPAGAKQRLVRLLAEDESWEVRTRAARTLGQTGDPAAVAALEAALADPNEFVRAAASNALKARAEPGG